MLSLIAGMGKEMMKAKLSLLMVMQCVQMSILR